jgi:Fe-S-cluster-containing dehydrogenase component/CRP-like cAMP-binding protein
MAEATTSISRPQRWDVPFDADMSSEQVDRILSIPPFSNIDASRFPANTPLRDILLNDTGLRVFKKHQVIVREGDYGNSAFFIIKGAVKATLSRDAIPAELLGRREAKKKSFFSTLSQLWDNPRVPEVRDLGRYKAARTGTNRPWQDTTAIFLHDLPAILKGGTARLQEGMFFGEIAALGRTPRTATVFADEDCELLEIRWQGLRELRLRAAEIKQFIDTNYRKYSLQNHLRETPYFKDLSPEDLKAVADQTRFETYGSFDWHSNYKKNRDIAPEERIKDEPLIAEEGQYANGLVLIRAGFARMSQRYNQGERTASYLARGQIFGFEEIAHNWANNDSVPLQYTLRALGYVDVIVVPTAIVEKYILPKVPKDELPPPITVAKQEQVTSKTSGGKLSTDFIEFLVDNRFINGRATMVMDLDRCTRCDDCVRACAAAHDNNPRFVRHGITNGRYMIANACMHCLDPVCMIGCPTGAIHRNALGGQVVINDVTCIGCSTCANSCPYNNIQMVDIRNADGEPIRDQEGRPVVKAAKCDLCVEQLTGPACVQACPHDALTRVDMQDTQKLAKWLQR